MRQDRVTPWLASLVLHAVLLVLLGLVVFGRDGIGSGVGLLVSTDQPFPQPVLPETRDRNVPVRLDANLNPQPLSITREQAPDLSGLQEKFDPSRAGRAREVPNGTPQVRVSLGGGLEGRQADRRARLAREGGGDAASEAAVAQGLRWLMAHQLDDGSWRFDFRQAPQCRGQCGDHGSIGSSTAATALALLPFLGAGFTHTGGEYQQMMRRGIYYLSSRERVTPQGGDLQEGTMYAQGLATLALCEAYAMTADNSLRPFARSALDFIVHAQHQAGGWRYVPGQPGDTTVTGWQVMALKSGQLAGFEIPQPTWYAVSHFLDGVAGGGGSYYGYLRPEPRPTTTAIGLLCRMYLGWPRHYGALERGVERLAELGPSPNDMYFNYYASQVMHHYQGSFWKRWNPTMRQMLVDRQATEGHETGSWQFSEPHSREAGRLYNTAMAIMTLEVYYRYLPLYRERAVGRTP